MSEYLKYKQIDEFSRVPLSGNIDFTYRCNNHCRHCWLRIPGNDERENQELSFGEIEQIVEDARRLGCRRWNISGGEPMLRKDFTELFEYITHRAASYSINTNGTLITPKIAKLMKRKGTKAISIYGAKAAVHDHITQIPGSFESMMQGVAYLKEAGVGFTIQIVPLKDNYHQYEDMLDLAGTLSPHKTLGATWLYQCASGDEVINNSIKKQRLDPSIVVGLDAPEINDDEFMEKQPESGKAFNNADLFSCIHTQRSFYVDPYGKAAFCPFIKDSSYQYDLKKGNLNDFWEDEIQRQSATLKQTVEQDNEYKETCGSCQLRVHCNWCPVYAYLEHRRFSAKVDCLCEISQEAKKYKKKWVKQHRAFFEIAGMTMQVDSDLPINENTFNSKFKKFEVTEKGDDTIMIKHHFRIPDITNKDFGEEVYRKIPWAIYRKKNSWIYAQISESEDIHQLVEFSDDHTHARIYSDAYRKESFLKGDLKSLTLFPTDQVLLARILADRRGCYIHSSGVIFNGKGFLFGGKSGAGKTTIAGILKNHAEILCDDRMIIRRLYDSYRIYGTWSHGDLPDVSANSAPLKAIFFLEQSLENKIELMKDKNEILKILLGVLIRPFVTVDWWDNTLNLLEHMVNDIPFYRMHFNKDATIIQLLKTI